MSTFVVVLLFFLKRCENFANIIEMLIDHHLTSTCQFSLPFDQFYPKSISQPILYNSIRVLSPIIHIRDYQYERLVSSANVYEYRSSCRDPQLSATCPRGEGGEWSYGAQHRDHLINGTAD